VGAVLGFILIFFLAAYLVIDGERISRGLLTLVPPEKRPWIVEVAEPVLARIGGYVRGQILVSLAVGSVLSIGLSLLGVPSALLIGGLAAAFNIVPFLGSIVAAVLGILVALNVSLALAVWTALLFWGTNLLEGKVLVPQLLGRATGLHPLAVLLVLLVGSKLAGLVGAIVAVPLLAGVNQLIQSLYVRPMNEGEGGAPTVQ
jgi:predicted PurR-regulated permease PerM